ncbi:DUF6090 family protein, partial [Robiginitalea sp.]
LYAVGEILLVVIGILIALQINEWQENKVKAQKGLELLTTLKRSMKRNLDEHQSDLADVRISYESSLRVLDAIENDTISEDSLKMYFSRIDLYSPFFPDYTGYEALKQGGLERIISEDLEYMISDYYEGNVSRANFFQSQGQYNPSDILQGYIKEHFEVLTSFDIDSVRLLDLDDPGISRGLNQMFDHNTFHMILPRDLEFVLSDPKFKVVLIKAIQRALSLNHLHVRGMERVREIDSFIEVEIERIEGSGQ